MSFSYVLQPNTELVRVPVEPALSVKKGEIFFILFYVPPRCFKKDDPSNRPSFTPVRLAVTARELGSFSFTL